MADIHELLRSRRKKVSAARKQKAAPKTKESTDAEIIIFPGVQYVRNDRTAKSKKRNSQLPSL